MKTNRPFNMYRVNDARHAINMVVGAYSYRHAAQIVAEVLAENSPQGTGGVCCVDKLCGPEGGGVGYYAAMVGQDRYYDIRPNKIKLVPEPEVFGG